MHHCIKEKKYSEYNPHEHTHSSCPLLPSSHLAPVLIRSGKLLLPFLTSTSYTTAPLLGINLRILIQDVFKVPLLFSFVWFDSGLTQRFPLCLLTPHCFLTSNHLLW